MRNSSVKYLQSERVPWISFIIRINNKVVGMDSDKYHVNLLLSWVDQYIKYKINRVCHNALLCHDGSTILLKQEDRSLWRGRILPRMWDISETDRSTIISGELLKTVIITNSSLNHLFTGSRK